jgi:hypothetical protein
LLHVRLVEFSHLLCKCGLLDRHLHLLVGHCQLLPCLLGGRFRCSLGLLQGGGRLFLLGQLLLQRLDLLRGVHSKNTGRSREDEKQASNCNPRVREL